MFSFTGNSKNIVEHAVHSTGVPLSERFKAVPSHNPLRPNFGLKRVVARFEDDDIAPSSNVATVFKNPIQREQFDGGLGGGINKLAIVRAKKDAEILQLRAQVQAMQMQIGSGLGKRIGQIDTLRTIQKLPMKSHAGGGNFHVKRRGGGGFVVSHSGGNQLNLRSTDALSILGVGKILRDPRFNGSHTAKGARNVNFFGTPKTKAELDKELDSYMSKVKSKQKIDLDKDLDEYMKIARAQSSAMKLGVVSSPLEPTTPPLEEAADSDEMEIAE